MEPTPLPLTGGAVVPEGATAVLLIERCEWCGAERARIKWLHIKHGSGESLVPVAWARRLMGLPWSAAGV